MGGKGGAAVGGVGGSTAGTGGAAGTRAGGSGGAPAGGAGGAPACAKGVTKGSDVLLIGDSFIALSRDISKDLNTLARSAGALGATDSYLDKSVSGTQLSGGISPQIPVQYTNAAKQAPVKVVIMDGGGNDMLNNTCSSAQLELPGDPERGGRREGTVFEDGNRRGPVGGLLLLSREPEERDAAAKIDVLRGLLQEVCTSAVSPKCYGSTSVRCSRGISPSTSSRMASTRPPRARRQAPMRSGPRCGKTASRNDPGRSRRGFAPPALRSTNVQQGAADLRRRALRRPCSGRTRGIPGVLDNVVKVRGCQRDLVGRGRDFAQDASDLVEVAGAGGRPGPGPTDSSTEPGLRASARLFRIQRPQRVTIQFETGSGGGGRGVQGGVVPRSSYSASGQRLTLRGS